MTQHVALLVELAALYHAQVPEDLSDGRPNRLGPIDDEQPGLFLRKASIDQVAQQRLGDPAVLCSPFPKSQNLLLPIGIDAQRDEDGVIAQYDPVDHHDWEGAISQRCG